MKLDAAKLAPVKVARKSAETPVIDSAVARPKVRKAARKRTAKARPAPKVAKVPVEEVSFGFPPPAPRRHKTTISRVESRSKPAKRAKAAR